MRKDTADRLEAVRELLNNMEPGLAAVSGGLDSRLLFHLACLWDVRLEAVHFTGPHIPAEDSKKALARLAAYNRTVHVLETDPLEVGAVSVGDRRRCYHCKRVMFERAVELAQERGLKTVMDGGNASDQKEYRPGLQALRELGVRSPFAGAGLHKEELYEIAAAVQLPDPAQPSRPCLLTRLDYGVPVTAGILNRLDGAENALYAAGFKDFRLRVLDGGRVVLQLRADESVLYNELRNEIETMLEEYGFRNIEIVFSEKVSGFFDKGKH